MGGTVTELENLNMIIITTEMRAGVLPGTGGCSLSCSWSVVAFVAGSLTAVRSTIPVPRSPGGGWSDAAVLSAGGKRRDLFPPTTHLCDIEEIFSLCIFSLL